MMYSAAVIALLVASPLVAGHGYLASITIDGKMYQGNAPGSSSISSPIRTIEADGYSPVKGANNTALSCGIGAQKAPTVASAMPGSTVSFKWTSITGGNWFHDVGPLLTYMASCGSAGCTSFNHTSARWFKVAQSGLRSDHTWAMHDLFQGKQASIALPTNIAPGEYLVRHELIALHTAQTLGGAEFYPACAQLRVSGSASGSPSSTVKFPGAYHDTDAGILIDAYDLVGDYVFPGPQISNLAGKTVSKIAETVALVANATAADETSSEAAEAEAETEVLVFPRRISRVMRASVVA